MSDQEERLELEIDLQGLKCPLPVLKLKKRICAIPKGSLIIVLTTDDTTLMDIPSYCELFGHKILEIRDNSLPYRFKIKIL